MTRSITPKVRGQRISEQELIRESQAALEIAGVPNHHRGLYVHDLAAAVVANPQPLFCQLQHKRPKSPLNEAWIRGYQLVFAYLATVRPDHNALVLTKAAISIEYPQLTGLIPHSELDVDAFDALPRPYPLNFDQSVDRYMKGYDPKPIAVDKPVESRPESPSRGKRSSRRTSPTKSARRAKSGS
jgi:hypothetical protein